jgi:hypothetical protein
LLARSRHTHNNESNKPARASFQVVSDITARRTRVHDNASQFKAMCDELHVVPDVAALRPFAHWSTPAIEKKRFDTHFFITALDASPPEIALAADGSETTHLCWMTPVV